MIRKVKALWENRAFWLGVGLGCLLAFVAGWAGIAVSDKFLSALATVMAVLCGLAEVSISILLVSRIKVLAQLRKAGFYKKLIGMVRATVFSSLLCAVVALGGLLEGAFTTTSLYHYVVFAVMFGAIFAFIRMFMVITRVGIEEAKIEMRERWGDESAPD